VHLAKRLHRAAVEGVDLLKLDAFDAHLLDELGEDAGVGLDGAPVGHIGDVQAPLLGNEEKKKFKGSRRPPGSSSTTREKVLTTCASVLTAAPTATLPRSHPL